ncbi:MAG: hypothetical protein LBV71_10420 [Prevotella sp.]|jgi:hypothetical protein|nr:hypothetical protein [Prevotella sp.]
MLYSIISSGKEKKEEEEKEINAERERYEALYNEILNYFSEKNRIVTQNLA